MKIAILHDNFAFCGGAEKLLFILYKHLSKEHQVDIYTFNISDRARKMLGDIKVNIIGGKDNHFFPDYFQAIDLCFRSLHLEGYDFYIMGETGTYHTNCKPSLAYMHWCPVWRTLPPINQIVCNGKKTAENLFDLFGIRADIIYPPIETSKYSYGESKGYWLSVNRIVPKKRIEMQIEAFREMPSKELIIVGDIEATNNKLPDGNNVFIENGNISEDRKTLMEYYEGIKHLPPNVKMIGVISENELIDLYSHCEGFLTTAEDEDFGMGAVEAMASGKPVVAPDEGGYRETVTEKTGIRIKDITSSKIKDAILGIGDVKRFKDDCIDRAKLFDVEEFMEKIQYKLGIKIPE